ncbi:hypothetical protein TUM20983_26640 [Mycobacterium antarcticum]|uniref:sensor domain-containing protein n=1 Tax=unclassified Mycolicibacterium TaxID=2636767 RepID=UPI002387DAD5|nr:MULTISPECIES: sensor domain-containing diguanylate cyclase [unclassified Mycolicibacterium]GLP75554.1 hypothetical protein TUM20983_26640 [Mycolicibacterium sp. TUM20983]
MTGVIVERAIEAGAAVGFDVRDGGSAGLVVQAANGEIVAATPEAERILGLTLGQMLGRTTADKRWAAVDGDGVALRPQDHPAMLAMSSGMPVRDAVIGVHRPGRDAAGEHIWLIVDSEPLISDGATTGVVSRFAAMTGPRATELRLAASERMYRWLVDNAPEMVAWQLPDTTFIWVSKVSSTLFGREPEEMIGATVYDFVHPEDLAALQAAESSVYDHPVPPSLLLRMRHHDGHYVWTEVAGQVLYDADGAPSQIRSSWRDVTARVTAERERDAALELVQSAIENSPIGIAMCLPDGTFERVNSALCAMLGFERDELVGRRLSDLVEPGDRALDGVATVATGASALQEAEGHYRRRDGTQMWGHSTLVAIGAGDGPTPRLLLQLQDITERRRALDELAHLASHDSLTGLANRAALSDHLVRAARELAPHDLSAMLFIDVDDFKAVNDDYGHRIGDSLLSQMGHRVSHAIRSEDVAARLGGDEFVVYCPKIVGGKELSQMVRRISGELSGPYRIGERIIDVSVSVGVTTTMGSALGDLMARSDQAMYRAKRAGRGLIAMDDPAVENADR